MKLTLYVLLSEISLMYVQGNTVTLLEPAVSAVPAVPAVPVKLRRSLCGVAIFESWLLAITREAC